MFENDRLTKNVDQLEGSVTELEDVEKELAKIAKTNNVNRLVYVVQENKKINEKMKVCRLSWNDCINRSEEEDSFSFCFVIFISSIPYHVPLL